MNERISRVQKHGCKTCWRVLYITSHQSPLTPLDINKGLGVHHVRLVSRSQLDSALGESGTSTSFLDIGILMMNFSAPTRLLVLYIYQLFIVFLLRL